MSKLKFSGKPYYDDFTIDKKYYKVLFNPKKSIQVRELNQIQSIFNNQIEQFADHIFKSCSRVDGGSVRFENNAQYVTLSETSVDFNKLDGKEIKGLSTGVTAIVKTYAERVKIGTSTYEDNTLYVIYTGAGTNGSTFEFSPGEKLQVQDFEAYEVTAAAVGKGSLFSVSESSYYVYGQFVTCPYQVIPVGKYTTEPTYKVGLLINQSIVDYIEDSDLLDNAIGSDNYGAPGADRYKIELVLSKKPIDYPNDDNFIELGKIRKGVLQERANRPKYGKIMDMIARRTYDESGDYTVHPFFLSIKDHPTDNTKFVGYLSDGKAYVKGYEIEKPTGSTVEINKARNTKTTTNEFVYADYGNKMYLKSNTGTFDPVSYIFSNLDISPYETGATSGTVYVKSFEFLGNDGTKDVFFINYFDANFNFVYNTTNPLNNLYDVNKDNTLLFKLPESNYVSVSNVTFTDNQENTITATQKTKTPTDINVNKTIGSDTHADISLGYADVYEVVSITNNTTSEDITDRYTLFKNANDNYYEHSFIRLNKNTTAPTTGDSITIAIKYYKHGNLTGQYFAADSYIGVSHEEYPTYVSKKGYSYNLRDCLDFRPLKLPSTSFTELNEIPKDKTSIKFDSERYVSRKDILVLSDDGEFSIVEGDDKSYPKIPDNSMVIYTLDINAYTANGYSDINQKYVENKRYTMADIGDISEKIEDLEYYVSLNLLDKKASELQVRDASGNIQYKNGFLTDDFTTLNPAATNSKDYQAGIDAVNGVLRPSFKTRNISLSVDESESSHYKITGDVITLPYTDVPYIVQPFSSKTVSVNPYFIFSSEGQVSLTPASDVWIDTKTEPELKVSIDTGVNAIKQLASTAGLTGTFWGRPVVTEEVIGSSTHTSRSRSSRNKTRWDISGNTTSRITTTTNTTTRKDTIKETTTTDGIKKEIEAKVTDYSLGKKVKDVQLIPYIRSTDVQFFASGLLKNTQHYVFFDDVDVNDNVRPINGAFGEILLSDEDGNLTGVFKIPNETGKRFFVGTKKFRVTNSSTNSKDQDELRSYAETDYHAGGLRQTKQETILSVSTPEFTQTDVETVSTRQFDRSKVINRTSSSTSTVISRTKRTFSSVATPPRQIAHFVFIDPIAQSFFVEEEDGIFLSKLDLYFSAVGTEDNVWLEIREMVNGYPGPKIIPFGRVIKSKDDISVSSDASIATTFKFESLIYLQGNTEYCFVVGSNDKEHFLHVSKLGGKDVATGQIISTQPNTGSLFKGQNNRTWNAEQYEDIKFTLYKAKFDISDNMIAAFNKSDEGTIEPMETNPFETTTDSYDVRVHHVNHGLSVGNKVKLNLLEDNWFDMTVISGTPVIGQEITGANGSFIIKDLKYISEDSTTGYQSYQFKITELTGYFSDNESITATAYSEDVNPTKSEKHAITVTPLTDDLSATLPTGIDNTFNGLNLSELSKKAHTISGVDSLDTFTITLSEKASATGRIGGDGNYIKPNIVCEAFELSAAIIDFAGTGSWYFDSIIHAGINSTLQNDLAITDQSFVENQFFELDYPIKMNTELNDSIKYQNGNRSFTAYGTYESTNEDLSPMINISSIGMTTYGNRIDNNDSATHLNWTNETDSLGFGSEKAKYVTIPVSLKDPANQIRIIMDIFSPSESSLQVWYRVLPEESYDSIINEDWIEFGNVETESEQDFIETEINIPDNFGGEIDNFKQFQIKIVMKTTNSAKVPKIKNLRCIALT